jgi:tetratricopeptide (TPR) repeat protein
MKKKSCLIIARIFVLFSLIVFAGLSACASQGAAQAEEYFTIGMAYFEFGKFAEAEMWLNRARAADKTMVASEYNLGRIAFETGRYEEAVSYFEKILSKDPENLMALKAAAYSRIKNGDIEKAEALYDRVLALVPESADDGFNYALVLYGLKKYENCEEVLNKYPIALEEKPPSILLLARAQKAMSKVEAVDSYAKWTIVNTGTANPQGLYEYGQALEDAGLYARALEQYQEAIKALTKDIPELKRSKLMFEEARLLLTVDSENEEGMTKLNSSVNEGFSDLVALEALLNNESLSKDKRDEISKIMAKLQEKARQESDTTGEDETEDEEEP